ncbi:MAG: hypothetical protein SFT68_06005 [Rickettsiaceae bacterium]|nr:hypothetical protein [Rickettsiaceae bacterium]
MGIQYYHFLDPLFQGDDKRESFPRRWESSITFSWIPSFEGMTRESQSHEGGNPVLPFPGSPFSRG